MRAQLRSLRRLSWPDRWLLVEAWWVLLALNLGLRLFPFRWVQRRVDRAGRAARKTPNRAAGPQIERCSRLVRIAANYHLPSTACLARSLALRLLLARRGIETSLRIGVQRDGEELEAHAWVEHAGRPVGEPEDVDRRYLPLLPRETR